MTVHGSTLITTDGPPKRLIDAIKKSKALTLEAWVTPANTSQNGPARIVTLSSGSVQRNLTLGQDGSQFEIRLRAAKVTRGLFVLHDLLYSRVGNPPPCVDTNPIPAKPGMSMRGLAEVRLADSSCTGCHVRFEPLAFGLEKFHAAAQGQGGTYQALMRAIVMSDLVRMTRTETE